MHEGQKVGNYTVIREIGIGGMGVVWEGLNAPISRRVAIKTLRPELVKDHEAIERFRREAQAVNEIGHRNIVEVFDFGMVGNEYYFVMQLLEGQPLKDRLENEPTKRLTLDQAESIVAQVAGALGAAHERGIIHRDVKPENIFLTRDGDRCDFVKVLDFGIAKVVNLRATASILRSSRGLLGTPFYMAPEQWNIEDVSAATDVYSLGCVLFEALTGRLPFLSSTLEAMKVLHLTEPPPPLREFEPSIPPEVEEITLRCLAKAPKDRFASMSEMAKALSQAVKPPADLVAEELSAIGKTAGLVEREERLRDMLRRYPGDARVYRRLGAALRGTQNSQEALRILEMGAALAPTNALLQWDLGSLLHAMNRFGAAADHLKQALQLGLEPRFQAKAELLLHSIERR